MGQGAAGYFASGEEVPLAATSFVAVDTAAAAGASVDPALLERLRETGRDLGTDLLLVEGEQIPGDAKTALDRAGAIHPVFRDPTGTITVVLPEVRVQTTSADSTAIVQNEIAADGAAVDVVSEGDSQFVLRPSSGRGADALDLANRLYRAAKPAMSQPRLLRMLDGPEPK